MTYLALARVSWIKAAITVGASTNLVREEKLRPEMKSLNKKIFGGGLKEKKRRSALFWVHLFFKKTPLLIMHGGSDWRVSPLDSIELVKKLYENHIPCRFILFDGADHVLSEHENESTEIIFSWFERFLKNNEALQTRRLMGLKIYENPHSLVFHKEWGLRSYSLSTDENRS
jgi:dipeptidyl aminopeptidase/acylaminoacyl peptidase